MIFEQYFTRLLSKRTVQRQGRRKNEQQKYSAQEVFSHVESRLFFVLGSLWPFWKKSAAWSIGLLLLTTLVHAKEPANQAFRSFWHPMYHNQRLNYCTLKTNECGKKVADTYCQMMGYQAATQNLIAYHLDSTQFIDSPKTCKKETCHGFKLINCVMTLSHTPPKPYHYTQKRFVYPRMNHYRIDWCYEKDKACGAPAAHSFCQQIGYMQADSFSKQSQTGLTQTLGSQELCSGKQCSGFQFIVCSR